MRLYKRPPLQETSLTISYKYKRALSRDHPHKGMALLDTGPRCYGFESQFEQQPFSSFSFVWLWGWRAQCLVLQMRNGNPRSLCATGMRTCNIPHVVLAQFRRNSIQVRWLVTLGSVTLLQLGMRLEFLMELGKSTRVKIPPQNMQETPSLFRSGCLWAVHANSSPKTALLLIILLIVY